MAKIVWPTAIAPYEVVVTVVKVDDEDSMRAAEGIYDELRTGGLDAILDDRAERPGVKFNDAELIGIPYRVTVGPRGLAAGELEVTTRATGETQMVPLSSVAATVADLVAATKAT